MVKPKHSMEVWGLLNVKKLLGKRLIFSFPKAAWKVGPGFLIP